MEWTFVIEKPEKDISQIFESRLGEDDTEKRQHNDRNEPDSFSLSISRCASVFCSRFVVYFFSPLLFEFQRGTDRASDLRGRDEAGENEQTEQTEQPNTNRKEGRNQRLNLVKFILHSFCDVLASVLVHPSIPLLVRKRTWVPVGSWLNGFKNTTSYKGQCCCQAG